MTIDYQSTKAELQEIVWYAEAIIYGEEGAHTNKHWKGLLNTHATAEFLLIFIDVGLEKYLEEFIADTLNDLRTKLDL